MAAARRRPITGGRRAPRHLGGRPTWQPTAAGPSPAAGEAATAPIAPFGFAAAPGRGLGREETQRIRLHLRGDGVPHAGVDGERAAHADVLQGPSIRAPPVEARAARIPVSAARRRRPDGVEPPAGHRATYATYEL